MKQNSFSPLSEDDEELHLPELVYWASLGDMEQVEQLLADGIDQTRLMTKAIVHYRLPPKMIIWRW